MNDKLPEYIIQGEPSRLFPVLSTTSKEGRATSIVLACLVQIDEFRSELLQSIGQRVGMRSKIETYTEVVLVKRPSDTKDRPDGLVVLKTGSREWRALVESKVGTSELVGDQIERYRALAKENDIDCVITLSNQFATTPSTHPIESVRKSRSKIPVYHWSWMHILTTADLLISQENVADDDQRILLNELRRFLTHESAGVRGFERMPKEWGDLNKLVSTGGIISVKSHEAAVVVNAWHQETRDLSLILSRMTEVNVGERLSRKHRTDPLLRLKDDLSTLRDSKQLRVIFNVPNSAAPLEVAADITRRCVDVGMTLRAPEEKKFTKARLNWLLRQIKSEKTDDLYIRLLWPGKNEPTHHLVSELRDNPDIACVGKAHLAAHGFTVFLSKRFGTRFTQQANFVTDLERVVPEFYGTVGSNLTVWKKPAPKIKTDKSVPEDVSTEAISEVAENFEG